MVEASTDYLKTAEILLRMIDFNSEAGFFQKNMASLYEKAQRKGQGLTFFSIHLRFLVIY